MLQGSRRHRHPTGRSPVHNQRTLQYERAEELFMCSKALADIVIPQVGRRCTTSTRCSTSAPRSSSCAPRALADIVIPQVGRRCTTSARCSTSAPRSSSCAPRLSPYIVIPQVGRQCTTSARCCTSAPRSSSCAPSSRRHRHPIGRSPVHNQRTLQYESRQGALHVPPRLSPTSSSHR